MPSKMYITQIYCGGLFHIFNRGINHQVVFPEPEDKRIFLQKFRHYLGDYAEVYSYCLMDNHYHFLVRVLDDRDLSSVFSKQFGKLILSYTHYFNKKYQHSGPIFHRRFKRLEVKSETYLKQLFWYIHNNPVKHEFSENYLDYPFSSATVYFIGRVDDLVSKKEGIEFFGSLESLKEYHNYYHDETKLRKLAME